MIGRAIHNPVQTTLLVVYSISTPPALLPKATFCSGVWAAMCFRGVRAASALKSGP